MKSFWSLYTFWLYKCRAEEEEEEEMRPRKCKQTIPIENNDVTEQV